MRTVTNIALCAADRCSERAGLARPGQRSWPAQAVEPAGGPQTGPGDGNGPHEEIDRRAIECFDVALSDAGLAADGALRQVLHDYFAWATTTTLSRYHGSAKDVPDGLHIPRWSWYGLVAETDGPEGSRVVTASREIAAGADRIFEFIADPAFQPRWHGNHNLAAAELTLSDAERERLDAVSAPPLLYPYWHQAKTASDRLGPADLTLLGPHVD